MKRVCLICCQLFLTVSIVCAQEVIVSSLEKVTVPDRSGQAYQVPGTGAVRTKGDLRIPFKLFQKANSEAGYYGFSCLQMDSLAENDVIALFIPDLPYSIRYRGTQQTFYDDCDNYVTTHPGLRGAWKNLTVLKKYKWINDKLVLVVNEYCDPYSLTFTDSVIFTAFNGYYHYQSSTLINRTKINASVESLKLDLSNEDEWVRKIAAINLGKKGDKSAIGPLLSALKYHDSYKEILKALYEIDEEWYSSQEARNIVPRFISLLGSKNSDDRIQAAEILACLKDPRSVSALILSVKQKDSFIAVRKALETINPDWMNTVYAKDAVPGLLAALKDDDELVRMQAAEVLFQINDPRAQPSLILALNDKSWVVRSIAVAALKNNKGPEAVDLLIHALEDENATVRSVASARLAERKNLKSVEPLILALKYPESFLDIRKALNTIYPGWIFTDAAKNIVPYCADLFKSEDFNVRLSAVKMFSEIGDKRAAECLIITLSDADKEVRYASAIALGELKDKKAVEPLILALKDDDKDVRYEVVSALGKIGDDKAVKPLIDVLKNGGENERGRVPWALKELKAVNAIEPLIKALEDKVIYDYARKALDSINPDWYYTEAARNAVSRFISLLKDEDKEIRCIAAAALESLKDERSVEPLISLLNDNDRSVRYKAASALGKIKDRRAVKPLIEALNDPDNTVRSEAALSLGEINDKRAVKPLEGALKDKDKYVRRDAAKALKQITGTIYSVE